MQQLKAMRADVRQQESAEINNSKLALKEELDKTAASKKNASHLTQFIIPYPKTVEEYIAWLKNLLRKEIDIHKKPIIGYIASLELKQKEKQTKYSMSCLIQFISILQQQRLETELPSKLYQSAMSELIVLVLLDIADRISRLTAQERHNYERIAKFNRGMMLKFESKVKYPQQVYSIEGMVNFDIMALFFRKNYRYKQKYGIQCLIPQRIANTLFKLTSVEFNRFEERFLDAIELIDLKFINDFDTVLNLFCLIELKHKLAYMQRAKYKYKRTYETWQKELSEPKGDPNISFQFCEIALFPFYSKKTSEKKSNKVQEKITREMQEIANKVNKWLVKTELLRIKNQNHLSLKSTLQFFNKIRQNPERKIILTFHQKAELYRQLEETKWIYFTKNTALDNRNKDFQFYLQSNKLNNQLSPSAIITFKIAMQRYKLMQRVNTSLFRVLRLVKRPIIFINRHVFSFSSIKGTASHDEQSLITNPVRKKDIFYAHVLGVRNGSVSFSAISDSKMIDSQYSEFLLDFCVKKLKINGESVVLYEFEHNRQVNWEALTSVLRGFKMKMSAVIIVVNNLKMFVLHYFVNISVEWLLRSRSQELTSENFSHMIKTAQAYIFNIIFKAKETIQKLLDEAVNEDQTYQSFFALMIQKLLQILMKNQDEQIFLKNLEKYQHCNHTVQYSMQPFAQSKLGKKKGCIHYYETIPLQKKTQLENYLHQQFKKKYIYLDDYDKEEASTNFSLLLEKYSMASTDVKNILSKCSKFILIAEVIIKEIEREFNGSSENTSEAKQLSQKIELLRSIFELQREKIEFISPGERSSFLKKVLCLSKYPATKLILQ